MPELGALVEKVRSKNAGPFWITIDIFCGDAAAFQRVAQAVSTDRIAGLFQTATDKIKRFDIPDLNVVKFSIPRTNVQGTVRDRDMHGASWAALVSELEVN